ncbi:glycosyltransferase [Streptomyces sp. 5K101]|uniref:glycosyltransferase n=1 Tax=Streptomyces sp. 5K101 TaxID=3390037 RepID=UPI00397499E4
MTAVRICEVIKTLDVGGAEVLLVERLRRAPRDERHYTVVFLHASTETLANELRDCGVNVVDLQACPQWLRYAKLVRVVRKQSPDIVNVHSPAPAAVLRPFLYLMRRRPFLVSTVHQVWYRPLTMLLDRSTRWLDDVTVAVSPQVATARTVRGARQVRTRIHGVDVGVQRSWAQRAQQVRSEFDIPLDAFVFACVANLNAKKNHALLLEAAEQVLAERDDALFVLAGDGPLREQVLAEIGRRGLRDRVRFLGAVEGANRLVAAADALVLASTYEGLPVVIMEAIAAGVPVVSTAVGGVPDLVRDGDNGILVPHGSPQRLADGMLRAMHPDVHAKLAAGARAGAEAVDVKATAAWFDELYGVATTGGVRD